MASLEEQHDVSIVTEHTVAETHEEVSHTPTVFAEPLLHFDTFVITNSIVMTWAAVLVIVLFSFVLRSKLTTIPRGIQNFFEMVLEGALNLADSVTGNRKKTLQFFPIVFALFVFILVNNWIGLVPGIGTIGFTEVHDGHETLIPFFRGGTADLNTTLALALFAIVASHVIGVMMIGVWAHINKLINITALIEIPKKILKDPTVLLVNPIKFFVGILELIGEIAKVASLSLRLFGNVFAGEVLLAAMASIFAFVIPVPFYFLEVFVGVVQAFIFSFLVLLYFTMASVAEEH